MKTLDEELEAMFAGYREHIGPEEVVKRSNVLAWHEALNREGADEIRRTHPTASTREQLLLVTEWVGRRAAAMAKDVDVWVAAGRTAGSA